MVEFFSFERKKKKKRNRRKKLIFSILRSFDLDTAEERVLFRLFFGNKRKKKKKREFALRTKKNAKRIRRIRARSFTFPQDYSKLVYISRDLRENSSSPFFLRERNFNANADNVTFAGNYTPNFKLPSYLHPSFLSQKRIRTRIRIRRRRRIDPYETLIEWMRIVRSINDSFDSKSGGASIAPMTKVIFEICFPSILSPVRRKISHAAHSRSRANISFMQNRFNAHSGGVSLRPTTMTTK